MATLLGVSGAGCWFCWGSVPGILVWTPTLAEKIVGLRIFEDAGGKMNLAVAEIEGGVLVVSQFTLYGDVRRGKRPSFDGAADPQVARELYEYFVGKIRAAGLRCETGRFQEMMRVELVNEGPVTILLDSGKTF
jgi:D-tyrosyl-tRNA(Tyr) deacylase